LAIQTNERYSMGNIRRYYIPGATYFITNVTKERIKLFRNEQNINLFFDKLNSVEEYYPFKLHAYVLLLDHFHFLIQPLDCNISKLMQSLQRNFTNDFKSLNRLKKANLWQIRFWDHIVRNEIEFERLFDYVHYNPVKHRLVAKPEDWPHCSFRFWLDQDHYEIGWGHKPIEEIEELDWEYGE